MYMRAVVGRGTAVKGCIADLALQVRDKALSLGFTSLGIKATRNPSGSLSKYLTVADSRGRHWIIRISNHFRPRRSGYATPHFDLISFDCVSGVEEFEEFLRRILSDNAVWISPDITTHMPPRRRSKLKKKGRRPR